MTITALDLRKGHPQFVVSLTNRGYVRISQQDIPTRLDLAGTWIDQPYISQYHSGWALTTFFEPTFEVRDRCGLSTFYTQDDPKDMAGEVAKDGPKDARMTRVLL